ncbi:hypothetical protein HYS00_01365 [Candidatus Microgenomates bacterium]|nr:hypothetical protein [Candidatus Microgenomates bacterium]
MDLTQIFLVITLAVTTIVLIFVGYQVFLVLREMKNILVRMNNVVGGLERMSTSVESGFNEVAGFVGGAKSVFKILEIIKNRKGTSSQEK